MFTSRDKRGSDMPNGKMLKGLGKSNSQATIKTMEDNYFRRKKLPDNFAEELLNLELDAEQESVEIKTIMKLLELYANAVEYYEAMHNDRYKIFQSKMNNLMRKPNVIAAMNKEMGNKANKEQSEEEKIRIQKNAKRKELEMNLYYAKETAIMGENPKKMIEGQRKEIENTKDIIQKEIDQQKSNLLKRLEERKMKARAMQFHKSTSDPVLLTREKRKSIIEELTKPLGLNNTIKEEEVSDSEDEDEKKERLKMESKRKSIVMLKRASKDLTLLLEKKNIAVPNSSERKISVGTRPQSSSITKIQRDMKKKGTTIQEEEYKHHENRSKNDIANPDSDSEASDSDNSSSLINTRKNTEQIEKSTELSLNLLPVIENFENNNDNEKENEQQSNLPKENPESKIDSTIKDPSPLPSSDDKNEKQDSVEEAEVKPSEINTAECKGNEEIQNQVESENEFIEKVVEEIKETKNDKIEEEVNPENENERKEENNVTGNANAQDLVEDSKESNQDLSKTTETTKIENQELPIEIAVESIQESEEKNITSVVNDLTEDVRQEETTTTSKEIQSPPENINSSKIEEEGKENENVINQQQEVKQEEENKSNDEGKEVSVPNLDENAVKQEKLEEVEKDKAINSEYEEKYLEIIQKYQKKIDDINLQIAEKGSSVITQKILKKAETDRDKDIASLKSAFKIE